MVFCMMISKLSKSGFLLSVMGNWDTLFCSYCLKMLQEGSKCYDYIFDQDCLSARLSPSRTHFSGCKAKQLVIQAKSTHHRSHSPVSFNFLWLRNAFKALSGPCSMSRLKTDRINYVVLAHRVSLSEKTLCIIFPFTVHLRIQVLIGLFSQTCSKDVLWSKRYVEKW